MFFALLTFIAAFSIEAIGTVVSVIGLSTLFGANPIIMTLAVALDVGKLVVVSLLYKHWQKLNFAMKSYGLVAATVTMIITSAGAAGYLSGEFQKAILGTQEISLKVDVLREEQTKLEARKKQIDDQIANLPSNYSRSRITLMKQFEDEQKTITARLNQIQQELPQQQLAQIGTEAKAGPILYIAKAFDVPVEEAVKWVILMIIFVFDPLAVFLIVAGNFLWERRQPKDGDADLTEIVKQRLAEQSSSIEVDIDAPEPLYEVRPAAPTEIKAAEPIYEVLGPTPPEVKFSTPDASQAKVYTAEEVIEANPKYETELQPERPASVDVSFQDPPPSDGGQVPLDPDIITRSSLTGIKPDPKTIVDVNEVGFKTGVYRSGQSK